MTVLLPEATGRATDTSVRRELGWIPVCLTTIVTLEALRVLFPNLYGLKERTGQTAAVLTVALVVLVPVLTPTLIRIAGRRRALAGALGLLACWRLGVQLPGSIPTPLAAGGAMVGLVALTLALLAPAGADPFPRAVGLILGFGADLALMAAFGTWDPVFGRDGAATVTGLVITGCLVFVALGIAFTGRSEHDPRSPSSVAGLAVGAVVAIEILFLANVGYLAAAAGFGLGGATAAAAVGLLAALAGLAGRGRLGWFAPALAAVVLTATGYLLPEAEGALVVGVVWVAQAAAGIVVGAALGTRAHGPHRSALGLVAGWAVAVLAVLAYQLHYDQPLPVDNRVLTAGLGLLTFLVARPRQDHAVMPARRRAAPAFATMASVGLLATTIVVLSAPAGVPVAEPVGGLRVVQWNVRLAVDDAGMVDPEAIAQGILAQGDVDVVVINEAARGWPLSGQIDLAHWLARRLDRHVAWAGAASQQFGNLVLSRFPIESTEVIELPTTGRAQGRSLLRADLAVGDGTTFTVLATHLQHRNDPESMAKRMEEIDIVIAAWGGKPATILAGDLNPAQGDPPDYPPRRPGEFVEIARLLDAGLTTGAELDACTIPTAGRNCSDYIFVSPDLEQHTYVVGELFGDHRMLVSTVVRRPSI